MVTRREYGHREPRPCLCLLVSHIVLIVLFSISRCPRHVLVLVIMTPDEPTNHLDLEAVLWLEAHLQQYPHTIIAVSHDRGFLNEVCTDTIHFTNQKQLVYYKGNYDTFVKLKREKTKNAIREYNAYKTKRDHMMEFIIKFRANAKRATMVHILFWCLVSIVIIICRIVFFVYYYQIICCKLNIYNVSLTTNDWNINFYYCTRRRFKVGSRRSTRWIWKHHRKSKKKLFGDSQYHRRIRWVVRLLRSMMPRLITIAILYRMTGPRNPLVNTYCRKSISVLTMHPKLVRSRYILLLLLLLLLFRMRIKSNQIKSRISYISYCLQSPSTF